MQKEPQNDKLEGAGSTSSNDVELVAVTHDAADNTKEPKPPSRSLKELPRLIVSRRWWWTTLLVLLGMALFARLGVWQLSRLSQRKTANEILIQQLDAPPLEISGSALPTEIGQLVDRLARVRGEFDYKNEIILTQQRHQDRLGEHLITPLIIQGTEMAILIDRGWIPSRETQGEDLLAYNEGTRVSVQGVVQASETISGEKREDNLPKQEWYRVDIESIEKQLPYRLLPIYLKWLPRETDIDPPIRVDREIDLTEGSHLGYAIQWFTFSAILGIGYAAFLIRNEN